MFLENDKGVHTPSRPLLFLASPLLCCILYMTWYSTIWYENFIQKNPIFIAIFFMEFHFINQTILLPFITHEKFSSSLDIFNFFVGCASLPHPFYYQSKYDLLSKSFSYFFCCSLLLSILLYFYYKNTQHNSCHQLLRGTGIKFIQSIAIIFNFCLPCSRQHLWNELFIYH